MILDANGDNSIDLIEFETVFGKYLNKGGPVQEVSAKELMSDMKGVDEKTAKSLAKQMNNEIKKTTEYSDLKLESLDLDELEKVEEQRVQDIMSGNIPTKMIGGELILKIAEGQNFVDINGKERFCFSYDMPRYGFEGGSNGKLLPSNPYNQGPKDQNPETGTFKIKLKLPIKNHNMVSKKDF